MASKAPKKKSFKLTILSTAIWSTVILCFGIYGIWQNKALSTTPIDITQGSRTEMTAGNNYYLGEVSFIDSYCEWDDNEDNAIGLYCLVTFTDGDGDSYLASLSVGAETDLWDQVTDYLTDDSQPIGSLTVPVYCHSADLDDELTEWFKEVAEEYTEYSLPTVALDLTYQGQTTDTAAENNGALFPAWGCFVMIALGILGYCTIPYYIVQQKKLKNAGTVSGSGTVPVSEEPPKHFDTSTDKDPWE